MKPVIALNGIHVTAYEVPDRLAEHAALIDLTCVFPWCTRPAKRLEPDQHRTDCDHVAGGCTVIERGTYLWTSPDGYQFLRDHEGTLRVSRDRRPQPEPQPPDGNGCRRRSQSDLLDQQKLPHTPPR